MIMWLMSGRGRPRSWRMMDGFPINTFMFINEEGKSTFVRFHFCAVLGVNSLLLDEANIIGDADPDFHRKDLAHALDKGYYPEYEFGVQLIAEEDEFNFDFDLLDDIKLRFEEEVPVEIVEKMILNKLTDNEFAETEQAAFNPSNVVPGIAAAIGVNPPSNTLVNVSKSSPAPSMTSRPCGALIQKVGILIGNGFTNNEVEAVISTLNQNGAFYDIFSDQLSTLTGVNWDKLEPNKTFTTCDPTLFDSLYVVGGTSND